MNSEGKIILACDGPKQQMIQLVEQFADHPAIRGFKVHKLVDEEVFRFDGEPMLFETLAELAPDKWLWADLKIIEIPKIAKARIKPYVDSGLVQYISVMAEGKREMMEAAVEAAQDQIKIVAVTKLTSINDLDIEHQVVRLANDAYDSGIRHLVCSGKEVGRIKRNGVVIFTPGMEPKHLSGSRSIAERSTTVAYSLVHGADAVVIGEAIWGSDDPEKSLELVVKEIEKAPTID